MTPSRENDTRTTEELSRRLHTLERTLGVLRTAHAISRHIPDATDARALLTEATETLTRHQCYKGVWAVAMDAGGHVTATSGQGVGHGFDPFMAQIRAGDLPSCMQVALTSRTVQRIESGSDYCATCPLRSSHDTHRVFISPMQFGGRAFGIIGVLVDKAPMTDTEEEGLLAEVAHDIALGLHRLELAKTGNAAEQRWRESRRQFETLVGNIDGMVYRCRIDQQWTMEFLAGGVESLTGYQVDDLIENRHIAYADLILPEDQDRVWRTVQDGIRQESCFRMTYRIRDRAGNEHWVWERGRVVAGANGKPEALEGIITDVSDSEVIALAFQERDELYRAIVHASPLAIALVDPEGRVLLWNEAAEHILAWPSEEAIGATIPFERLDNRDEFRRILQRVVAGETCSGLEMTYTAKDGHLVNLSVSTAPVRGAYGRVTAVLAVMEDITDRKQTDKELRERQELLEAVFDTIPVMIDLIEQGKGIIWTNAAWQKITGYSSEDLITGDIQAVLYPDAQVRSQAMDFIHRGDGTWADLPLRCKDGHECLTSRASVRLSDGRIIGIGQDISDRVQADRERLVLQDQLQQAQKMESLGRLAGGVAHDFNNLLAPIIGYTDLLLSNAIPAQEALTEIRKAGERARDLVRQLLALGRKQMLDVSVIHLNLLVTEIEKMLRRVIGEDLELILCLDDRVPSIKADPGQIEQVLLNLVVNARDAMPDGGQLVIETSAASFSEDMLKALPDMQPGEYARLAVNDNGAGMDDEVCQRIFDPFFTTKEAGKGTGLGLAVVYGIVRQHGGGIRVFSEPGAGTTFEVYFPATTSEPSTPKTAPKPVNVVRGHGKVLVVEDEPSVRMLTCEILRRFGYTVLEAAQPDIALLVHQKEGPVDLVVSDVVMPGMAGPELCAILRERQPGLKVLLMSGHADEVLLSRGLPGQEIPLIQKPFSVRDFIDHVQNELGQ